MIFVLPQWYRPQYLSPLLLEFVQNPSPNRYSQLLASTGGAFAIGLVGGGSVTSQWIAELTAIHDEVRQGEFGDYGTLPQTRAGRVREAQERNEAARDLSGQAVESRDDRAGLLLDEGYFEFMKDLLHQAQGSIKIIMFFMKYIGNANHPTEELIEELLLAKARGVTVQVILDRDREEDVFNSELINTDAFNFLKEKGVDVVFDLPQQATHTKMVLVDGRHLVLGSHNWTAGSLRHYDDTSIYLSSDTLGRNYAENFNSRFEQLIAG